jgi:hypothetical protein
MLAAKRARELSAPTNFFNAEASTIKDVQLTYKKDRHLLQLEGKPTARGLAGPCVARHWD